MIRCTKNFCLLVVRIAFILFCLFLYFSFRLLTWDRSSLPGGRGDSSVWKGGYRVTSLFSLTIRLLSNGGFCIASSFRSLFLLFFSVWAQNTGAFCELVRVVCQASEFRRVFQHSQCNCVYSFLFLSHFSLLEFLLSFSAFILSFKKYRMKGVKM